MPRVTLAYKEEVRGRILDAARRCFRQTGYDATTMDAIAQHAGLSKGSLYLYFPSKEALFEALSARNLAEVRRELQRLLETPGDASQKAQTFYARLRERTAGAEPVYFEVLAEAARNARLARTLRAHRQAQLRTVSDFLRTASGGRELAGLDANALSAGLIALFDGLLVYHLLGFAQLAERAWTHVISLVAASMVAASERGG